MAAVKTKKPAKARTLADMTVGELREVIRETVRDVLIEMSDGEFQSDDELELRPEVAEYLEQFLREKPRGVPIADAKRRLGLND